MEKIKPLLTNGDNLKEMYGLKVQRAPLGSKFCRRPNLERFLEGFPEYESFLQYKLAAKGPDR